MALQVWLPLNKSGADKNQGLANINIVNNASYEVSGKLGGCYKNGTINSGWGKDYNACLGLSASCWINIPTVEGNAIILGSVHNYPANTRFYVGCYNGYFSGGFGNTTWGDAASNRKIESNTWYHLCMTTFGTNWKLYINGQCVQEKTSSANPVILYGNIYIGEKQALYNDFRIYDHTLSQKEVTELSRGCILHYPCNDILNEGTVNLVNSITAGGQTTVSNGVVTTSGVNADTYFTLNLSESITEGTQYTISCETNMQSGTYWDFPLGSQGNTNLTWRLKPGYNTYTFTANGISWGTQRIYMDDVYSTARTSGYQCKFFNFQLEKKDHATVYTPSSRTQTQLKDVSGFDNHSTISGSLPLSATPKSAHYDKCMNIDNSGTNKNYANCTIAAPQVKAASFWIYIGNSNPINQILFVDLASNMGFGFNDIGNIISHTTTGPYIPSVFSGSTTIKNSWNHFVINHLGTSTELYLNGVKLSSTSNDGWTNNVNGFYFGRRVKTDYDYYYTGKVSDFRLFSRVLSQHDVNDLYKDTFIVDNK